MEYFDLSNDIYAATSNHSVVMSTGSPFNEAVILFMQTHPLYVVTYNASSRDLAMPTMDLSEGVHSLGQDVLAQKSVMRLVDKVSCVIWSHHNN